MKHKKAFLLFSVFLLVTLIFNCTNKPDDIAVSADGVEISFHQEGNGAPAIIFIPGWTNPKTIWSDQVAHFSQKYKTVSIDLAGTGESGNNRNDWTITSFGNDVVSVVNKLKLKQVVLVGFSMGAAVALETAKEIPEKVVGVVLVDDLQDPEVKYPPEIIGVYDSIMMDVVSNISNEKLVALGFYKMNPEENFKRVQGLYPDSVSMVGWHESLLSYFSWINEDLITTVENLKIPVTAINSDMVPTNIEAFRKYIPSFQAKIITDVGHLLFWEKPEDFNRMLEQSIQEFVDKE
jgi:pimeloyl-ACP methyl ester carboxylesterase